MCAVTGVLWPVCLWLVCCVRCAVAGVLRPVCGDRCAVAGVHRKRRRCACPRAPSSHTVFTAGSQRLHALQLTQLVLCQPRGDMVTTTSECAVQSHQKNPKKTKKLPDAGSSAAVAWVLSLSLSLSHTPQPRQPLSLSLPLRLFAPSAPSAPLPRYRSTSQVRDQPVGQIGQVRRRNPKAPHAVVGCVSGTSSSGGRSEV